MTVPADAKATPEPGLILVPSEAPPEAPAVEGPRTPLTRSVPCRLEVSIPIPAIRLRDLQSLRVGTVFVTAVPATDDAPIRVGGALMAWGELDNVEGLMAIRLARLA